MRPAHRLCASRTVSFALGETWQWDGDPEHAPTDYHVTWAREFRYDGARQRYLNRQLDAGALEAGSRVALSDVWSDYDGNAIYGDFEIDGGGPVDVRSFEPGLGTVGWLGGQPDTSTAKYYHTNMIGTTRFMSDAAGSKIEPAVYAAFGERIDGTNHRYGYAGSSGYQAHDEMPFLHVGHRYYDPATGRFLQRDPIGIRGGLNVYAYAGNKPTIAVDPDGQFLGIVVGIFVAAVVVKAITAAYDLYATSELARRQPKLTPDDYEEAVDQQQAFERQRQSNMGDFAEGVTGVIENTPGTSITGPPTPPTKTPEIIVDVVTGCASQF